MSFKNILKGYSLDDMARLVTALGEENVKKLIDDVNANAKYGRETIGNFEAIINKLTPSVYEKILRGDLQIKSVSPRGVELIEPLGESLFSDKGVRIKPKSIPDSWVCKPNSNYYLKKPDIAYIDRFFNYFRGESLSDGMVIGLINQFEKNIKELISEIESDDMIKNILKGVYLPMFLPKIGHYYNLGDVLSGLVKKLNEAYKKSFPTGSFKNNSPWLKLKDRVHVRADTFYQILLERLRWSDVEAIYFPTALYGFSTVAQVEQMKTLPPGFILAGPIEIIRAGIDYTEVLFRDNKTPSYDSAAIKFWNGAEFSEYTCMSLQKTDSNEEELSIDMRKNVTTPFYKRTGGLLYIKPF